MAYHGLLDWKLGMAYVRILSNSNYVCGLDGKFNTPELSTWLDDAHKSSVNFAKDFECKATFYGKLPGIEVSPTNKAIIVHPLWRTDRHKQGILADAAADAGGEVKFTDTFNLARRPGSSYLRLGESIETEP